MRFYTARVTTSLSKPPQDMSALRPVADTLNRIVRSLFTPPERRFFKPEPLRAYPKPLNYRTPNIRTKMAVVRLRQPALQGGSPGAPPRRARRRTSRSSRFSSEVITPHRPCGPAP
jgi:hypothetical protein